MHTCVSFSCFLILLNLKKASLSLNDGLFLMELGALAGAGQGIGFRGEVEGNLGKKRGHKLYNFTWGLTLVNISLYTYFTVSLFKKLRARFFQNSAYLYSMLLSSRSSVPQRPFTSSITWFFRNFFRS